MATYTTASGTLTTDPSKAAQPGQQISSPGSLPKAGYGGTYAGSISQNLSAKTPEVVRSNVPSSPTYQAPVQQAQVKTISMSTNQQQTQVPYTMVQGGTGYTSIYQPPTSSNKTPFGTAQQRYIPAGQVSDKVTNFISKIYSPIKSLEPTLRPVIKETGKQVGTGVSYLLYIPEQGINAAYENVPKIASSIKEGLKPLTPIIESTKQFVEKISAPTKPAINTIMNAPTPAGFSELKNKIQIDVKEFANKVVAPAVPGVVTLEAGADIGTKAVIESVSKTSSGVNEALGISSQVQKNILAGGEVRALTAVPILGEVVAGSYLYQFGKGLYTKPAETLKSVGSKENVGFALGYSTGGTFVEGAKSTFKEAYIGADNLIPAEMLVPPEVLSGKARFVEYGQTGLQASTPSQAITLFQESQYGKNVAQQFGYTDMSGKSIVFSASPQPISGTIEVKPGSYVSVPGLATIRDVFGTTEIKKGQPTTGELPGLFTAPAVSKYFLKSSNEGGVSFSLLPESAKSPTIQALQISKENIMRASSAREPGNLYLTPATEAYLGDTSISKEFGIKTISKPEIEAQLPPSSAISYEGTKYTKIDNQIFPIKLYSVIEAEKAGISPTQAKTSIEAFQKEYQSSIEPSKTNIPASSLVSSVSNNNIIKDIYYKGYSSSIVESPKMAGYTSIEKSTGFVNLDSVPAFDSSKLEPSKPSTPSIPSAPSFPSRPSRPSTPSKPSKPSSPTTPSIPSIPSIPSTPSTPSVPSTPSIPSTPSTPSIPSAPNVAQSNTILFRSESTPFERVSKGFYVITREFGKEVKANIKPLSRAEALRFGGDITASSISASFKVVPTNPYYLQRAKRVRFASGRGFNPARYREGKSTSTKGYFVEKEQFRIKSFGEKYELKQAKKK